MINIWCRDIHAFISLTEKKKNLRCRDDIILIFSIPIIQLRPGPEFPKDMKESSFVFSVFFINMLIRSNTVQEMKKKILKF